ncbi:MAG: hypothetical protein V3U72_00885 [Candidatus Aenigmarchaeota archaeon]
MDKKIEDKVKKRMKEKWIKVEIMIEAMAISKEAAESALEKHVEKMEKEKNMLIYKKDFKEVKEVERPLPNIPKGFSHIVEIELVVENFDKLIYIVLNYGPSSIEILEPDNIKLDLGEAQGILNTLAALVHRFAAMGAGGMLVSA